MNAAGTTSASSPPRRPSFLPLTLGSSGEGALRLSRPSALSSPSNRIISRCLTSLLPPLFIALRWVSSTWSTNVCCVSST